MSKEGSSKRILLLSDLHLRPSCDGIATGEDTETLQAVERYVKNRKWDVVIQIGDLMDLDCISDHNNGKPALVEGRRLQKDYDHANRWLDRWQRSTGSALWYVIEGNHDYRAVRYAEHFPAMQGKVELPVNLQLKQRGITWVPYWSKGQTCKIGNAHFGHGRYVNEYHAKKHLQAYGVPFYYGHVHDVSEHSMTRWGDDKTICAKSMGCLCRYDQPYMQGRPSKWQQAFGEFYVRPSGYFQEYTIKIFNNSFTSPDGEYFRGR